MGNGFRRPGSKKMKEEEIFVEPHQTTAKVLLLGPSCSGKSRFMRGHEIIHKKIDEEVKKKNYLNILRKNWNQSLISIAQNEDFQKRQSKEMLQFLKEREEEEEDLTFANDFIFPFVLEFAEKLREANIVDSLWRYNTIPYGMIENMGDLSRFNEKDYCPTDNEILHLYSETNGIVELDFDLFDHQFILVDVGGARYNRRKWIHCLEDLSVILYFVNLGEYDLVLREDKEVNRLDESFLLFVVLRDSPWVKDSKMVIIFDNEELFRKKVETIPMTKFLDFRGGSYEETLSFIQSAFEKKALEIFPKERFSMITTTLKDPIKIQDTFERAMELNSPSNIKGAR